ncbi:MAG: hypothetical protein JW727_04995 [Candidatus Aenigmarchaeota archaeon]|nr:hypothetical protein [Candidatus Aenigmarchaeota archaeon]
MVKFDPGSPKTYFMKTLPEVLSQEVPTPFLIYDVTGPSPEITLSPTMVAKHSSPIERLSMGQTYAIVAEGNAKREYSFEYIPKERPKEQISISTIIPGPAGVTITGMAVPVKGGKTKPARLVLAYDEANELLFPKKNSIWDKLGVDHSCYNLDFDP